MGDTDDDAEEDDDSARVFLRFSVLCFLRFFFFLRFLFFLLFGCFWIAAGISALLSVAAPSTVDEADVAALPWLGSTSCLLVSVSVLSCGPIHQQPAGQLAFIL